MLQEFEFTYTVLIRSTHTCIVGNNMLEAHYFDLGTTATTMMMIMIMMAAATVLTTQHMHSNIFREHLCRGERLIRGHKESYRRQRIKIASGVYSCAPDSMHGILILFI